MKANANYGFIDLHTHILPGVDDGAKDISQAVKMISMAYANGTRGIFLTPHYGRRFKGISPDIITDAFESFSAAVRKQCPDLNLYLGSEIHYELDTAALLEQGACLTLHGTDFCLIEFGTMSRSSTVRQAIWELVRYGYTPIIAHAERYSTFVQNPSLVEEVLSMGALIQINADSVLGRNGFKTKRFCARMLKRRQVHFIGSDAHDLSRRRPKLYACWKKVLRKYGPDYASELFCSNAQAVINQHSTDEGDFYGTSE